MKTRPWGPPPVLRPIPLRRPRWRRWLDAFEDRLRQWRRRRRAAADRQAIAGLDEHMLKDIGVPHEWRAWAVGRQAEAGVRRLEHLR